MFRLIAPMLIGVSISGLLQVAPAKAAPLPSESDLLGIERVCAGGRTYGFSASVSAALTDWRKGAVDASSRGAVESLGAIIARIPHDVTESKIFTDYTKCIRDLIEKFLTTPDPNKVLMEPTVLELKTARFAFTSPLHQSEESEEIAVQTRTHGMFAQRVKMQAFLEAAVIPNFDSTHCPAKGNTPTLVVGFLVVDKQKPFVDRVSVTNDPTGTIGVLRISDVPSTISKKFSDFKVKMGSYADCVQLDREVRGDLIVTYYDYQSVARTDYFSIQLYLDRSQDGALHILKFFATHESERPNRMIDDDRCAKKTTLSEDDRVFEIFDQYKQDLTCEAHDAIDALNDFDATLHRRSNWQH
jgi:hypothetical protein